MLSFFRWLWGDSHNIHHRQVNDDMTLTNHNEENQELVEPGEEHPGLYFEVKETLLLAVIILMVLKLIMYQLTDPWSYEVLMVALVIHKFRQKKSQNLNKIVQVRSSPWVIRLR